MPYAVYVWYRTGMHLHLRGSAVPLKGLNTELVMPCAAVLPACQPLVEERPPC